MFAAWDTAMTAGSGSVMQTTMIARFGNRSLAASCAATDDGGWVTIAGVPDATGIDSGDLYIRVFVRIASSPAPTGSYSFVRFIENGGSGINLEFTATSFEIYFSNSSAVLSVPVAPVLDDWMCVAAHVVVGDAGSAELTVSGVTRQSGAIDTLPSNPLSRLSAGATYCGGPLALNLDEVALSGTPLPCP
jgi:hypothetical protein